MKRIAALAVVLGSALAHAQAPAVSDEEAQRILNHGVQLLDSGHVEEARAEFEKVRALVPDKANPYRLLGVADFRLGRCKEAVAELETFLSRVGPNDRRVTEVVSMRDRCREELQPKVGLVAVDSTPRGAEVRIDDENGEPVGVTPFRNEAMPAGAHVVFLRKPGYLSASRGFTLQKGDKLRIDLTLVQEVAVAPVEKKKPVYKKGWFWGVMVVSAVVVGGGVAAAVLLTRPAEQSFSPTLPPYMLGLGQR